MVQLLADTAVRIEVAEGGDGSSSARQQQVRGPGARGVVAGTVLAGVCAVLVTLWLTAPPVPAVLAGLPSAGAVTRVGLPVAQFISQLAGIAVVGVLFLRVLIGTRDAQPGHQYLGRMAARWARLWLAGVAAWLLFTLSDLAGVPVTDVLARPELLRAMIGTDRVMAEAVTLWIALLVALFAERMSHRVGTGLMGLAAAGALLPSALTGHAAHGNSAVVLSTVSLGVHIVAASLWVGGLLALVVHLRRFPEALRRAVPLFSAAALGCVAALGASGVLAGVLMLDGWAALWETSRGHLILAKTAALVVLVGIGHLHRKRTVAAACSGRLWPLLKLGAAELALMGATVGVAVVLSTTA
jgi:putative copper export protein